MSNGKQSRIIICCRYITANGNRGNILKIFYENTFANKYYWQLV